MYNVLDDIDGLGLKWKRIYGERDKIKRQALLRHTLQGYNAIVDAPGCMVLDDLMELYPDAKVVLGLRTSPEQWRQSISKSLDNFLIPSQYLWSIMFSRTRYVKFSVLPMMEQVCSSRYDAQFFLTDSTAVYTRHNEWVRKIVPKDKLLELTPTQGWKPLCEFLGKSVPTKAYPRLNDTAQVKQILRTFRIMGGFIWVVGLCTVVASTMAWLKWDAVVRLWQRTS